jgi:hypothetical protein
MDLYCLFSSTLLTQFHSWAVRNAGLMLFSSIVNNLTGADEGFYNHATKLSWDSFPGLAQLILRLLIKGEKPDELTTQSEPQIGTDVQRVS